VAGGEDGAGDAVEAGPRGGGGDGETFLGDGDALEDDVVMVLPRYAIPNITSILPEYSNAEQAGLDTKNHEAPFDFW
jgi:hypothetical protein